MSKLVVLYNYNKYYNRIIKRKSTFQEYVDLITPVGDTPAEYRGFIRENLNFDYQDGVYAMHVINILKADPQYAKIEHPDYCVLEETYVQGEGDDAITTKKISRYFILDVTKVRGNQWRLSLRRDLLADYYSEVLNAPVFVEKGWVNSLDDPAIFNKESMSFNQIKQGEILLNQTKWSGKGKGWVVGYIAKGERKVGITDCETISEPPAETIDYDDLPTAIKTAISTQGKIYIDNPNSYFLFYLWDYHYPAINPSGVSYALEANMNNGGEAVFNTIARDSAPGALIQIKKLMTRSDFEYYGLQASYATDDYEHGGHLSYSTLLNQNIAVDLGSTVQLASIVSDYNGKYVLKDGQIYRLNFTHNSPYRYEKSYTGSQVVNQSDSLASYAKGFFDLFLQVADVEVNDLADTSKQACSFWKSYENYSVALAPSEFDKLKCDIPANRNENFDGPYDVFCMPLGALDIISSNVVTLTTFDNVSIPMARGIAIKGSSAKIYDIQILPYCPDNEMINSDGNIDITGFTEHEDYEYIYKVVNNTDTAVGIILFPKRCKGSFDITIANTEPLYDYLVESRDYVIRKKLRSETNLIRFVSPNFASQFEINAQKNKGITNINVDYFYKPYTPYIHVAPYFNGLYGQDYNDPKGLICSGDFSIATTSSKWEEYQIQNKNYELTFNRQIENLDVNNSIAYQQAAQSSGIGVATSALTGAGAGAFAGGSIGSVFGPVGTLVGAAAGAVVGAVAGGVTSGVGRKYDLEYLKQQQSEARAYAVDMYAYSLQNIHALPYTLTKVSAFTPNNKIFPFIEVYDCTDEEKATFTAKLRYNGMTIMRIGKIADFLGEYFYVSGQLIRLTGIEEDSHVVAEIAKEIKEGAYYYGSDSE